MKFEQIVFVDETGLVPEGYQELQRYSSKPIIKYTDYPSSEEQIIERIRTADCVLVSWNTPITASVINTAKHLKYIGMCCSLYDPSSANVDVEVAQANQISVKGVRDYGDEGVVEFIFAQLITLYKGLGGLQWGNEPTELKGKAIGIIGFGTVGQMVAKAARAFGMSVLYYSRTRRPETEDSEVSFATLSELLVKADVVSTHLPKGTYLLRSGEFEMMKPGSILINTSLGPTFNINAFLDWISQGDNYAIFDADGGSGLNASISNYSNVILSDKVAGWTVNARGRLTEKVIENIRDFIRQD